MINEPYLEPVNRCIDDSVVGCFHTPAGCIIVGTSTGETGVCMAFICMDPR